ncbi:glycine-rich protein DOT1-like [Lactuca sativa]|uniref:glycine-rich protein DOT1-like n=1 Tax=Lactuca sativa TaxID=4236 RepID=UPI000CD9A452|nr:glycine-rich protein DOT1-like [Lactuca sativa]
MRVGLKYLGFSLHWHGGGGGGGDRLAGGDGGSEGDDGEAVEGEMGSDSYSVGSDLEVAGKGLDRGCSGGGGGAGEGGGSIGSDGIGDIGVEGECVVKYSSTMGIEGVGEDEFLWGKI